ncbi:MAG TPA: hypothetical protein VIJ82_05030 [Streptosporangiaceae bacterium]
MSYHIMGHPVRRSGGRPALALGAITLGGLGIGGFGGGGLGRGLVHLFIWRLIWRGGLAIWRVPIFGPAIDIVLALAIVALLVLRSQLGPGWWQRLGRGPRGGGSSGGAPGGEPRGW